MSDVTLDYFSFMSSKSEKPGSSAPMPITRVEPADRPQPSQMEVTESALSDTAIKRMFGRPIL